MKENKSYKKQAEFWDARYGGVDYIYGKKPNEFLTRVLAAHPAGRILFPGDGEGRNSVYAASAGWEVTAFDYSSEAVRKARMLAQEQRVTGIDFHQNSYFDFSAPESHYDAIAFIYTHMPPDIRVDFHRKTWKWLKPGGMVIMEAFHKDQLPLSSGGPKQEEMLYDKKMLRSDFRDFKEVNIKRDVVILDEGAHHSGKAMVIRMTAIK